MVTLFLPSLATTYVVPPLFCVAIAFVVVTDAIGTGSEVSAVELRASL